MEQKKDEMDRLEEELEEAIYKIRSANFYIENYDELIVEIRSTFHELESLIEDFNSSSNQPTKEYTTLIANIIRDKKLKMHQLQSQFQKASQEYQSKKNSLLRQRRRELLQVGSSTVKPKKSGDKFSMQKQRQKSINKSLERTRSLLSQSLSRTTDSMVALQTQSEKLAKTVEKQEDYGSVLSQTNKYLNQLKRIENLDQLVTLLSIGFFFLVVAYIFESRIGIFRLVYRILYLFYSLVASIGKLFFANHNTSKQEL